MYGHAGYQKLSPATFPHPKALFSLWTKNTKEVLQKHFNSEILLPVSNLSWLYIHISMLKKDKWMYTQGVWSKKSTAYFTYLLKVPGRQ